MVDVERTSGITLLVNWANTQDHWVRALVGAVLETRRGLSDDVVTEFYELLLREKELSEVKGEPVSVPPIEHDGEPGLRSCPRWPTSTPWLQIRTSTSTRV